MLGGGRYIEQSVIGLGVDIRQATARKVVLREMALWGILFRRRIPAPPCGLLLISSGGGLKVRCMIDHYIRKNLRVRVLGDRKQQA